MKLYQKINIVYFTIIILFTFFYQEAIDTKLIDAKIFNTAQGTGVAVLTTSYSFFLVNSVKEPRVRRLPEVPGILYSIFILRFLIHWLTFLLLCSK